MQKIIIDYYDRNQFYYVVSPERANNGALCEFSDEDANFIEDMSMKLDRYQKLLKDAYSKKKEQIKLDSKPTTFCHNDLETDFS
jgi:hypothetical protein